MGKTKLYNISFDKFLLHKISFWSRNLLGWAYKYLLCKSMLSQIKNIFLTELASSVFSSLLRFPVLCKFIAQRNGVIPHNELHDILSQF